MRLERMVVGTVAYGQVLTILRRLPRRTTTRCAGVRQRTL